MKVRCIRPFYDYIAKQERKYDDEFICTKEIASLYTNERLCVIVPEEEKKENKKAPTKKVEKK